MSVSNLPGTRKTPRGVAANPDLAAQSVADYAAVQGRRTNGLAVRGILLALLVGAGLVAIGAIPRLSVTPMALSPALSLAILAAFALFVALWRYPGSALPITFGAACLLEAQPLHYTDSLTDAVPFFWNVNTIFQVYAHVNLKAVPVSLMEVVLLAAGLFSLLQSVLGRRVKMTLGTPVIYVPMLTYAAFVLWGFVNGLSQGGDFKLALQETRAQFYFVLLYFMTVNLVKDRAQIRRLLWTLAGAMAIKSAIYVFRRYITLGSLPLPDGGVGSHEEAFLFDCAFVLALCLSLCETNPRLQRFLWIMMPLIALGNLATNRRAGTAALFIAFPILLLAVARSIPRRRAAAVKVGVTVAVIFAVYYPLFKNSNSIFALPARSLRSQFNPDERDASSNAYRDAENANLMATIRVAPWLGYGYGRRFLHVAVIANISEIYEWWDLLPHNQILWVWMRVGSFGYFAFWFMFGGIMIHACFTVRRSDADPFVKAVALNGLLVTVMLLLFGLLDLQLSNFRSMIVGAVCAGLVSAVAPETMLLPRRAVRVRDGAGALFAGDVRVSGEGA